MGLESKASLRKGRKLYQGKLHVDSKELTFRSTDFKCSIELGPSTQASVKNEFLLVQAKKVRFEFTVSGKPEKWVDKINHPPNRLTKLGIKPSHRFWLSKGFAKSFADELKSSGARQTRKLESCDLAFWKVAHRIQLEELEGLTSQLADGVNLWIVWPKGSDAIKKSEVMETAKSFGFGPSKTAAFDDDHSSMRYARRKL